MALQSPGVEVTVIDESFYTPGEPGTTPLIVVATAQDKTNAAGTGIAAATTKVNAGRVFRLTGQRDLVDLYGVPFFEKTASGSSVHGGERNEYGLLSAYSFLGVSNSAFVVRADVDLAQLQGQARVPGSNPEDGQWWVDTGATAWGIQEWNAAPASTVGGQKFSNKTPLVLTDDDSARVEAGVPKGSVGSIGDYAVVFQDSASEYAKMYYKSAGNSEFGVDPGQWVLVGSNKWTASHPTVVGSGQPITLVAGDTFILNGTTIEVPAGGVTVTELANIINGFRLDETTGVSARDVNGRLYLYTNGVNDFGGSLGSPGDSTKSNAVIIQEGTGTILTDLGISPGTYLGPTIQQTPHTQVPEWKFTDGELKRRPTGSVWIKTTEPNLGSRWSVKRWNSATESWVSFPAPLYKDTAAATYSLDRAGLGSNIDVDSLFVQHNAEENTGFDETPETATFRIWRRAIKGRTVISSEIISSGTIGQSREWTVSIKESIRGQAALSSAIPVTFTTANQAADATIIATAINAAGFANIEASVTDDNRIEIFHKTGGDFRIVDDGGIFGGLFVTSDNLYGLPSGAIEDWLASNWQPLAESGFQATRNVPLNEPQDGQLWYNPEFSEVDLMVHNGNTWVGFNNDLNYTSAQVIISASEPVLTTAQQNINNHIWVSTADLENFPIIYRWITGSSASERRWELVDKTDQVSEDGILFADARWTSGPSDTTDEPTISSSIAELRTSNFLDPDAPDPALYPRGMLLWNTRRSGGNVKRYAKKYIDLSGTNPRYDILESPAGRAPETGASMEKYAADRWVTASQNNEDGSGSFGRKAQRTVVIQAMKSVVDTSFEARDEERRNFNIIAAPGYPELLSNLINLNLDRGITAFVVGDSPLRLPSDATSLIRWGTNENLVLDNGDDGIVSYDEYCAVFYPNGFTTDLGGFNAVVPASHMMLRTIALSDQVSYPWFAPAGTRRGGITNATAVGYIDSLTGEFQTVALNEGQRDVLYDLKVNPITFFNGVGLVNYGQKTRARNASALDRINVARLTIYLRSQLNKLARPYIFEPNDKITRDEIKQAVESLLLELVGLRALYDFAVVCDESNNTPARVDRNELWVDIAIEPVKAVEFIYIPLRVKNTGEI